METLSIKALALKALHGNQQGNKLETSSFQGQKSTGQITNDGNLPVPAKGTGKQFLLFYDRGIDDYFVFTETDEDAQALRDGGMLDVVYSHREIKQLEGLPPESIKAHFLIKKAFLKSKIDNS